MGWLLLQGSNQEMARLSVLICRTPNPSGWRAGLLPRGPQQCIIPTLSPLPQLGGHWPSGGEGQRGKRQITLSFCVTQKDTFCVTQKDTFCVTQKDTFCVTVSHRKTLSVSHRKTLSVSGLQLLSGKTQELNVTSLLGGHKDLCLKAK